MKQYSAKSHLAQLFKKAGAPGFAVGGLSNAPLLSVAAGGVRPFYTQAEKDWLEARKQEYADYNKAVESYNKQADDYQKQIDAYNKSIEPYQAEVDAYNKALEDYNRGVETYRKSLFLTGDNMAQIYERASGRGMAGNVKDPVTGNVLRPGEYYATLGDDDMLIARRNPVNVVDLIQQNYARGAARYTDPRTGKVVYEGGVSQPPTVTKDYMAFGGKLYEFAKAPGEFTAKMPGTPPAPFAAVAPTAPTNVPYTQEQVQDYANKAKARAQKSAAGRASALNVAASPEQYGLSGFGLSLPFKKGGEVSNEDFIQQMTVGTLPEAQGPSPADTAASRTLRSLGEVARGTAGADALEPGSEAYRTGQALANMPAVGIVAGTAKKAGKTVSNILEKAKEVQNRCEYMNCLLFAQELTGISRIRELPQVKKAQVGDIYSWGIGRHYAIDIGNGKVIDVAEWGAKPEVKSLESVIKEYDKADRILRPPEGSYAPLKKYDGGEVSNEDFIQQMTVGTPMTPQEQAQPSVSRDAFERFKAIAPGLVGAIPEAATTVAGNVLQGITDPKAHAKRSLENIARQLKENPEEFVMNWTGGGLGGVLKPKGGIFPKAGSGSGIDTFLQRVEEQVGREAQDLTIGQIKTLNEFIKDKGRKYLTTTYGTGSDPLRDALLEGRMPALGTDAKNFRDYMLQAAREGNPRALEDFETMYDTKSGIGKFVVVPSRDQYDLAAKIRDKATQDMLDKIAKEGVDPERITEPFLQRIDIESMLKDYSPEYQKSLARRLLNEQFPESAKNPNSRMYLQPKEIMDETLIRAAREGEIFYDMPASSSLDFLDPKNLAKSLATLNTDKLGNMSFAEAVIQGTKNTRLQRDWDEVIKKVEGNKSVPKEMFDVGTEMFRPMGQDKWVRLLTPQAVQLEGAAMHHSIGGYAKKGNYGEGGREALESGRAQIFSLRGPDNLPRVTVEAKKNDDGTLFVKQIKGNFNGVPDPADQEIIVQFLKDLPIDKIQPERYIKTRTGEELEEAVRIDWSERAGFGARSIF